MVWVEGEYLVWAKDPAESCNHYHLIGLNVPFDKALQIATFRADVDYPEGWERQGMNFFRKNQPGSPYADIMIVSFRIGGRDG